jgi:hypothetical protein
VPVFLIKDPFVGGVGGKAATPIIFGHVALHILGYLPPTTPYILRFTIKNNNLEL